MNTLKTLCKIIVSIPLILFTLFNLYYGLLFLIYIEIEPPSIFINFIFIILGTISTIIFIFYKNYSNK